ncbi:MAG: mandelate racemase [Spirochaetales bacterium]|nr:mandelate racemase [Spirochaetales bacterium]
MKITGIKTYVLAADLAGRSFGWSQRTTDSRQAAICVIDTDAGVSGCGEAFYFGGPASIVADIIDNALGPIVNGSDPMDTGVLWDRMYNWTRDQGQKGVTISAISAIDIALWDIKGKALDLPVYVLLGGAYRKKARVYATGLYEPQNVECIAEALVDEALGYKRDGFSAMKLKIGYGIKTDLAYVRKIREAIGPDISLMVDANHAYNSVEAIRLAREIAPFDIYWFEEPVPPEDIAGYVELRKNSEIPIAGGECEYTRYGFMNLINSRAVDVLQPDVCAAGGISEMSKITTLASAANIPVMPHVWGTNVGLSASLQCFAALPHFPERRFPAEPYFELDRSPHPLRAGVTEEQFVLSEGYIAVPDRPGLGVTLDMDFITAHAT